MAANKTHLNEAGLLSTHNICFVREIRKLILTYILLSGDLNTLISIFKKKYWNGRLIFQHSKIKISLLTVVVVVFDYGLEMVEYTRDN